MLRGNVPENEIVAVILQHFGRHVASSRGAGAGVDLARIISGVALSRSYDGADRLMALSTAATTAAGESASRLEVVTLPEPVVWERIADWVGLFSRNGQSDRIERCLFTARQKGDQDRILPPPLRVRGQSGILRVQRQPPDPGFSGRGRRVLRLGADL